MQPTVINYTIFTKEKNMDITVLILQIVTILVSISSLTFNLLSTVRENSKKNYIKVVTEQRLKNKSIVRENIKNLLAYSNCHTISLITEDTVKKSADSAAAIESVLKSSYPEDNNVLQAVNDLVAQLAKQINSKNNEQSIATAREKLLDEFSIYDLADWRFIKQQANGTKTDSKEFDKIYSETREQYNK